MTDSVVRNPERVAASAYFLGIQFLALPLLDFIMNLWPLQFGSINWRYGAAGLAGGFLLTPLLGFVILLTTAVFFGHGRALKVIGAGAGLVGVGLLLVAVMLVFDALQLRGAVEDKVQWMFDAGVGKALLKNVAGGALCLTVAVAAFRRDGGASKTKSGRSADPLLVAGK